MCYAHHAQVFYNTCKMVSHDKASGGQTTASVAPANGAILRPEFLRLPRAGQQDPHTGLTRTTLNQLILPTEANKFKPKVKSICLRQRGAKRGIRLIVFDSLMEYLRGLPPEGEAA